MHIIGEPMPWVLGGTLSKLARDINSILFSSGEPGFFYDADDWDTLFQDISGTQPVTAPNQGVALILDKSGNANNAAQATTSARPLSARQPEGGVRNLITNSRFLNASAGQPGTAPIGWTFGFGGSGVQTELFGEPDDTQSQAARFIADTGQRGFYQQAAQFIAGHTYHLAADVVESSGNPGGVITIISGGADGQTNNVTGPVEPGRHVATFVCTQSGFGQIRLGIGTTVAVNEPSDIVLARPQLEVSESTAYQSVGESFLDVTETGKRSIGRLYFNGTSHFLNTPPINTGTDKAQVFAGVRKLGDDNPAVIFDNSTSVFSGTGKFELTGPSPSGPSDTYRLAYRGTSTRNINLSGFAAPISSVISGLIDLSGSTRLRINQAETASTDDAGVANFANTAGFIGARAGTTLYFNGFVDQLVVRFSDTPDATTVEDVEAQIANQSPEVEL